MKTAPASLLKSFFIPRHTKSSLLLLSLALILTAIFDADFWSMIEWIILSFKDLGPIAIIFFGVLMPGIALLGGLQNILYALRIRILPSNPIAERSSIEMFALVAFLLMSVEYIVSTVIHGTPSLGLTIFVFYQLFYIALQMHAIGKEFLPFTEKIDFTEPLVRYQYMGISAVLFCVYVYSYLVAEHNPISWAIPISISLILWNVIENALVETWDSV